VRCVPARDFTVGKALAWRSAIDENAPYQREGAVWSLEQQQLFIDTLINGYDVPKIYLHDRRGVVPNQVYAIVDGKQRLTTIWRFLRDEFPLAPDFRTIEANVPDEAAGTVRPAAGQRYSELDPVWRSALRDTPLAVVLIQRATPDDIEDLFSRLNNGEPLNAAEKRNAIGGSVARLARELANHPFFTDRLPYGNERHQHLDVATRLLLLEQTLREDRDGIPDLHADALDRFVRNGRDLSHDERERLKEWALVPLSFLARTFRTDDELLSRQAAPPAFYLLARGARAAKVSPTDLRSALADFDAARHAALAAPGEADAALLEYTWLTDGESSAAWNLRRRVAILERWIRPE
jgi:hypothetical protein